MPETAVNKHSQALARKNNVGSSRKVSAMYAKPKTNGMQGGPEHKLKLGILARHPAHIAASLLRGQHIHLRSNIPIALAA
jgi:hypothetical protein